MRCYSSWILLSSLLLLPATALARDLPARSIVCSTEPSIRKLARLEQSQDASEKEQRPRDCYATRTLRKSERIMCNGPTCQIRLWSKPDKSFIAYTLRRYQP